MSKNQRKKRPANELYNRFLEVFRESKGRENGWSVSHTVKSPQRIHVTWKSGSEYRRIPLFLPENPSSDDAMEGLLDQLERYFDPDEEGSAIVEAGEDPEFQMALSEFSECMRTAYAKILLEEFLIPADKLNWSYDFDAVNHLNRILNRTYVELRISSPLGEDFEMNIDYDIYDPIRSFKEELELYVNDFNPAEHASIMQFVNRNNDDIQAALLMEDAIAIQEMIQKLYQTLSGKDTDTGHDCQGTYKQLLLSSSFLFDEGSEKGLFALTVPESCPEAEIEGVLKNAHADLCDDADGEDLYGKCGENAETLLNYVCAAKPWTWKAVEPDLCVEFA